MPRVALALGFTAFLLVTVFVAGVLPNGQKPIPAPIARTEVPVTAMNQILEPANNSPIVLADPTDRRSMVVANRLDAPDFGCGLNVSSDAGRTWKSAEVVPTLPIGVDKCYAPEIAFDARGTLYYLFVGLTGNGNEPVGVYLTSSADKARSFSVPLKVLGPLNFAPRMAIDATVGDKGRLHLAWLHATSDPPLGGLGPTPNPILAAYSDDGGRSFSEPMQISDAEREEVAAPVLALGPDHAVHVGYYDLAGDVRDYHGLEGPVWEGKWSIVLSSSSDGGRTFAAGVVVDQAVVPAERVMLIFTMPPPVVVAKAKVTCVAWTDARYGDADVLMRCGKGGDWPSDSPKRLNDDAIGNGHRQYLPRLSFAPDGRLDVIFFDRRGDPGNVENDVYFSSSYDDGGTLSPNLKVTQRSSSSRVGQQYVGAAAEGQVESGARLGLLSSDAVAVAAWPDTRYSNPQGTEQDLFAAEIYFPPNGRWVRVSLVIGGGVLLGAVVLAVRLRRRSGSSRTQVL